MVASKNNESLGIGSGNSTTVTNSDTLVGYVAVPNGRGTPTLVLSCLFTLILCAWSALHLNVPAPGQTKRQTLWLNARWIIAGIYCPELVVFSAWRQWSSARCLSRIVTSLPGQSKPNNSEKSKSCQWTMTHSFFASTGGFLINYTTILNNIEMQERFLAEECPKRFTISAHGIELLARQGNLPDVSKADIDDKSKSDAIGKFLVLTQALWFLASVLARPIIGLPVTLLEVNTVAHVLCTLLLYVLWWNKPYLPREPITIDTQLTAEHAAFMYTSSEVSGAIYRQQARSGPFANRLLIKLGFFSNEPEITCICSRPEAKRDNDSMMEDARNMDTHSECLASQPDLASNALSVVDDECFGPMDEERRRKANAVMLLERRPRRYNNIELLREDNAFKQRLTYLRILLQKDASITKESFCHTLRDGRICRHFEGKELICEYSRNWPYDELLQDLSGFFVGTILWTANLAYGAIHAAAWNDHFPSLVEKWLWRSSAVYVGFAGGLWIFMNCALRKLRFLDDFFLSYVAGKAHTLNYLSLGFVVMVCGCSLIFARIYLVIGAFLSVRKLPQGAYITPQWSEIFPHF